MRSSAPYQRRQHLGFLKHNDCFHEYSFKVKPANKLVYTELRALPLLYLKVNRSQRSPNTSGISTTMKRKIKTTKGSKPKAMRKCRIFTDYKVTLKNF